MNRPAIRAALLAVVLSLTLGGCAFFKSRPSDDVGAPLVVDVNERNVSEVVDGGQIRLPIGAAPKQFSVFSPDADADARLVWDFYNPRLVDFAADGTPRWNPAYVESATDKLVDGHRVVTYTLNQRATFNDGTPIDATAFSAAWRAGAGGGRVASVERGDTASVVVVTYNTATIAWQADFQRVLHPAAKDHAYTGSTLEAAHADWGAGPFRLTGVEADRITFERNPAWWGESPRLNGASLVVVAPDARLAALQAHALDATEITDEASFRAARRAGDDVDLRVGSRPAVLMLNVNARSGLLSDAQVRRGMLGAIDRGEVRQLISFGHSFPKEAGAGSLLALPFENTFRDNYRDVVRWDFNRAGTTLDHAGWIKTSDGIRTDAAGRKLAVRIVAPKADPIAILGAELVRKQLLAAGLQVSFDTVNAGDEGEWDLYISDLPMTTPGGLARLCDLYCSNGALNRTGIGPDQDAKLRDVPDTADASAQLEAANAAEKQMFDTLYFMPIGNGAQVVAARPDLANYGAGGYFSAPLEHLGFTG